MIAEGLYGLIFADAGIVAQLATYEFTTGTPIAAIFTIDPIPEDADLPAILIRETGGITGGGSRGQAGVNPTADVIIWFDKDQDEVAMRTLAWDVFELINRSELVLTGSFDDCGTDAFPPQRITDNDGFKGYLVLSTSQILEKN